MSIQVGNIWYNMTDEQIEFVLNEIKNIDKALALKLREAGDNPTEELVNRACGINQFCENLGLEGYEFS